VKQEGHVCYLHLLVGEVGASLQMAHASNRHHLTLAVPLLCV
jgi:hypothetical protein